MAHDLNKWLASATNGDVVRALIEVRLANISLAAALGAISKGNVRAAQDSLQTWYGHDANLRDMINEMGGLDPTEKAQVR